LRPTAAWPKLRSQARWGCGSAERTATAIASRCARHWVVVAHRSPPTSAARCDSAPTWAWRSPRSWRGSITPVGFVTLDHPTAAPTISRSEPMIPPPGPHGGDGPAVAHALGINPTAVVDLSMSLNPFAPDVAALVRRHADAATR